MQFDWQASFWPIIWDPKLCQICWWNINNNISFHYSYFQEKLTSQNFSKNPKNVVLLGPFWVFLSELGPKMNFPGKKGSASYSISKLPTIVPKNQKKLMSHSWENSWRDTPKTSLFHNFFVRYSQFWSPAIDWKILQSD